MADPLSITSGIIAIVTFAFKSSEELYQLVESYKSTRRNVSELRDELLELNRALLSLQEIAASGRI